MGNANKALLGFVIGAVILGAVGLLLAPHLLALVEIGVASSPVTQMLGASSISAFSSAFSTLMAVGMGLLGGLGGGLIGFASSKMENNSILQHTSSSSVAPIANEKVNGYSPLLDVDGQDTEKSFVKRYELEKTAQAAVPSSQLLH